MAIRLFDDSEREDVARFIEAHWRSKLVMSCGKAWYPHEQEGLVDRRDGKIVGLVTFRREDHGMEILTIYSTVTGAGLGSALMLALIKLASQHGVTRIWLATTNDNLRAVGFYQRLGFRLSEVHPGAVDEARKTKPEIPDVGQGGIPIHDEWIMQLELEPSLPRM